MTRRARKRRGSPRATAQPGAKLWPWLLLALVAAVALASWLWRPATANAASERWVAEVVARHPHDRAAFTQGLVYHDGRFYESTGRYGLSELREVEIDSGRVIRSRPLESRFFGEGLALVGERLIQLTYREGVAIVYDRETFNELDRFSYQGEGWGLCFDGEALWMSDGSSRLQRRDPNTFALLSELAVTRDGREVPRLNELACLPDGVVANVWLTDELVWIERASGRVRAVIDAGALVPDDATVRGNRDAVLNGVAHDPATGRWWLTGKLWPFLYEVRFVPTE